MSIETNPLAGLAAEFHPSIGPENCEQVIAALLQQIEKLTGQVATLEAWQRAVSKFIDVDADLTPGLTVVERRVLRAEVPG